jgi:XTP/dITP diphosphohydrolase
MLAGIGETLVIATHNRGKMAEFEALLAPYAVKLRSIAEFGLPEPEETGTTFEENARIKAQAAALVTGLPVLADDSGLCADALGGAPGVHTADWAQLPGGGRDFAMAMRRLEEQLQRAGAIRPQDRRGRFVAVLCLATGKERPEFFRGEVEGTLIWPPRGAQGFGYDPMFQPDGFNVTFGEMPASQKHGWEAGRGDLGLSHRARAFAKFAGARLGSPR